MTYIEEEMKALRVKCAEICGWKLTYDNPNGKGKMTEWFLPDYPASWDAIMPEVKKMLFSNRRRFFDQLRFIRSQGIPKGLVITDVELCLSTPAQITHAFILTHEPEWKLS